MRQFLLTGLTLLTFFSVDAFGLPIIVVDTLLTEQAPKSAPRDLLQTRVERPLRAGLHRDKLTPPWLDRGALGTVPPLSLSADLEGEWDIVTGYVTFPLIYEDKGTTERFESVVRGFATERVAESTQYVVPAWNRTAFWITFGDGMEDDVPRLVGGVEIVADYQPQADDGFEIFEQDAVVQASCTGAAYCSIHVVAYVELREEGVDYSAYPEGAAITAIYFVVDTEGDVISVVIDIYDADSNFVETRYLMEGDALELFTLTFKMDEPDFFYVMKYMEEREVTLDFSIEQAHYVPGQDFLDPDLPKDFDAARPRMQFLLEGEKTVNDETTFAYAGPFDLGFDWESLPGFVFRSNFEQPSEDTSLKRATKKGVSLVKPARN